MDLFFELIQVALGSRDNLSKTPEQEDWEQLYALSERQAVVGFTFDALEKLSRQGQKPPLKLLYQWIGCAEQIRQQNLIVNKRCIEATRLFAEAGFRTCILKGQGNARLYPNPLSRTSGDIDIWVCKELKNCADFTTEDLREEVDEFVHKKFPNIKGGKMHINYPIFNDVPVEVHYFPRYMNAPKHDKMIQAFFRKHSAEQFTHQVTLEGADGTCSVPTIEFNLVQQLSHLLSHFMGEGIGLRQFIDYYYVLRQYRGEKEDLRASLQEVGLLKFARGVMWVERNLLGLDDKYLIAEPSERIGRAIQQTIEDGGNFGHHNKLNTYRRQSSTGRLIGGIRQYLRALLYFPTEATWKQINKFI